MAPGAGNCPAVSATNKKEKEKRNKTKLQHYKVKIKNTVFKIQKTN